ncbi:MAG TPA: AmmeMemoRadiSam system protein B [Roseiarcus sp.]|nr:AmmeMemoRadiSam system protein B [Roseiarcus sp.]
MNRMTPAAQFQSVHPAQVAGLFYPGEAAALAAKIDAAFAAAPASPFRAKMIVVPHAGIDYSGAVAAQALRALDLTDGLRRVVILGPNHRMPWRGVAVHPATAWSTPLGLAPVAGEALRAILPLEGVAVDARPFEGEHSLEMPLIFLQRLVPGLEIVPLLVGDAAPELVEEVLARLWGGPETAICVSSDLSHFHPRETARALDAETRRLIEAGRWSELGPNNACGYASLRGAMRRAQGLRLRTTGVAFATSDEAGGPKSRVVGYGAFAFEEPEAARLSEEDRGQLIAVASAALDFAAENRGRTPSVPAEARLSPALTAHRAAFATLERGGALRGCIGSLLPHRTLAQDVAANAARAGFGDPRFAPLSRDELAELKIAISVLSPAAPLHFDSQADLLAQLRPGEDGLVLRDGRAVGLFLPSVWRELPSPEDFVGTLKRKAGLPAGHWSPTLSVERFTTESFGGAFVAPGETGLAGMLSGA